MAIKNALRKRYRQTFADAGLATLKSDPVPEDQVWCIQRHSVEGTLATSGGNTRLRTYIEGHGDKLYLNEEISPTANELYWDPDTIYLHPRERLALEWDQAQAGTILQLTLLGYYVTISEVSNA
ncbi:MAG: hypothetical protein M1531_09155 [Chloroflexi bacterium]|nr:hypothetical protein [Chloroflexota bacterium]